MATAINTVFTNVSNTLSQPIAAMTSGSQLTTLEGRRRLLASTLDEPSGPSRLRNLEQAPQDLSESS